MPKKLREVYITASYLRTSKGPVHHGDYVKLPEDEAENLAAQGWAEAPKNKGISK